MKSFIAYCPTNGCYLCAECMRTLVHICLSHTRYAMRQGTDADNYWIIYRGFHIGLRYMTPPLAIVSNNTIRRGRISTLD